MVDRRVRHIASLLIVAGAVIAGACTATPVDSPRDQYWRQLTALCNRAFEGTVVEAPPNDTSFAHRLVMHVRECSDSVVKIPFHVGENHSRTWVLTRTGDGIRLKHDHRHEDGQPDSVTQYGGNSRAPVLPGKAEFPADSFTKALIPAAATNVWTVEVDSSTKFVYALRREGTDRRFKIQFDLTKAVEAPPAPWGH